MPYSNHRSGRPCTGRSAFTLIELLIVIGIISILIVLGLSVAGKVSNTGRTHVTKETLKVLDSALTALIQSEGSATPPAWVIDPRPTNNMSRVIQPVVDGRCETTNNMVNSVGLFLLQCNSIPSAKAALKGLDSKFIREYTPDDNPGTDFTKQWSIPTVFDAWGNPIRYVHPAFKGTIPVPPAAGFADVTSLVQTPQAHAFGIARIRRSNVAPDIDADGGLNAAARPYFYSAGPDGDPSTIEDNIYLTVPRISKN